MKKSGSYQSAQFPEMIVLYSYMHDPGIRTFANGDPGYPPSTEWQIDYVQYMNNDRVDLTEHQERILNEELDRYIEKNERSFYEKDDNDDYELRKLEN